MKYEYECRWGRYERKKRTAEGRQKTGKGGVNAAAGRKEMAGKKMEKEVILQYREYEVDMDDVVERVISHYMAKGNARESIESVQIYAKPEDFTAYYVINDGIVGKVNLF